MAVVTNGEGRRTAGAGRLLELGRTGAAETRVSLTRESGLARATVNDRLDLLLDAGLLSHNGNAASTGGRRAAPYAFNAAPPGPAFAARGPTGLPDEPHRIATAGGPEVTLGLARERLPELLSAAGRT